MSRHVKAKQRFVDDMINYFIRGHVVNAQQAKAIYQKHYALTPRTIKV
jgi:argininosuccinate synthase